MTEAKLQWTCIKWLDSNHIPFVRVEKASRRGAPDLFVFARYGIIAVELKRNEKAATSPHQEKLKNTVNAYCNFTCFFKVSNFEDFKKMVDVFN